MRLFTALWVPAAAAAALSADLGSPVPRGWRMADPQTWHLTLAFHGEADPGVHARRLEHAARHAPVPRLRLAGAGVFPGVRWAGVEHAPGAGPAGLVTAAGGERERFVPHVTVLRLRPRPGPDPDLDAAPSWARHRGPWWVPAEVLLVASEPGRKGSRYQVVHRVPLPGARGLAAG